jgi:hypothetical protein
MERKQTVSEGMKTVRVFIGRWGFREISGR